MPFDAPEATALPLPPNYSQANFDAFFARIYAEGTALRTSYASLHSPVYLQPHVAQYLLDGTVLTPLPVGWSNQEFLDWMAYMSAKSMEAYYAYMLGHTPPVLQDAVKLRINYGLNPAGATPLVLNFLTDALPVGVTLVRPSIGWARGNTGVLTPYANNVPRFQHDSVTNASLGLLNEYASTNTVRNNSMAGVVAGTPGTAPTNWTIPSTTDGVTRTIVGTGVEDGIPYIDVRYFGTPTTGAGKIINFDSSTNPAAPAAAGQNWIASAYIRLLAGVLPIPNNNRIISSERSAAGGNNGGANGPTINPTNAPLRQQRISVAWTFTNPTTAFALAQMSFSTNAGEPCDFTLRFGAPAMVQNPALTSIVLTTGAAAVTRAADVLTVLEPVPAGYYDVTLQRLSGTITQQGIDLTSGSGYNTVVAPDPNPVQKITLALSI